MKAKRIKLNDEFLAPGKKDHRWDDSPFVNLRDMAAKTKGTRYELITRKVMGGEKPEKGVTDYDMVIGSKTYEIKGSMLNANKNPKFSFLQIRPDQEYDYLMLVGFFFDGTIEFYTIPHKDVNKFVDSGVIKKQHLGKKGKSGTFGYIGDFEPFKKYLTERVKVTNNV